MKLLIFLYLSLLVPAYSSGKYYSYLSIQDKKIPLIIKTVTNNKIIIDTGSEKLEAIKEDDKFQIGNYDSYFKLNIDDKLISGVWIRKKKKYKLKGSVSDKFMFNSTKINLPKSLRIDFNKKSGYLIFSDNHASILTQTGDYRFLTPKLINNKLILTGFDGVFSFYIEGLIRDNKYTGTMYSKDGWTKTFRAYEDKSFKLKDLKSISRVQNSLLNKKLKNLDGQTKLIIKSGTPNIIQIFGSWCPNCIDEVNFLNDWRKENKSKIKFSLVAFERGSTNKKSLKSLKKAIKIYNIQDDIFIGSLSADKSVVDILPEIENFKAFPTTIFINSSGEIKSILTGFSGPATGVFHQKYINEFEKSVNQITNL